MNAVLVDTAAGREWGSEALQFNTQQLSLAQYVVWNQKKSQDFGGKKQKQQQKQWHNDLSSQYIK